LLLPGCMYNHSVYLLCKCRTENESLSKTWANFAQQRGGEDEVREAVRKLIEHSILASHRDPPGQPEKGPANPPLGLTSPCEHASVEPAPFVTRSDADPIDGALCTSNRWSMDPYSTSGPRAPRNRIFYWQLKESLFLCLPAGSIVLLARIVRHILSSFEESERNRLSKREVTLKVNAFLKARCVFCGRAYAHTCIRKHDSEA